LSLAEQRFSKIARLRYMNKERSDFQLTKLADLADMGLTEA